MFKKIKQHKIILFASLISLSSLIISVSLFGGKGLLAAPNANTLYVAPGGVCSASPCFSTIQAAVNAAASGDEIRVATGTYSQINSQGGLSQIVYINKTISLRGGYSTSDWNNSDPDTNPTTLNAQNMGRVIYITGNVQPEIEGFSLTNGNAQGLGGDGWFGWDAGGNVYIDGASTTLKDNKILNGDADFGGGVYLNRSDSLLVENEIRYNDANNGGGVGIWFSYATLDSNTITNNRNNGVWLYGFYSRIHNNLVSNNTANFNGGGFELYYGSAIFSRNTISFNNASHDGGAIAISTYSSASFDGDIIHDNQATNNGGGIFVSWHSTATIDNVAVLGNRAGSLGSGIYLESSQLNARHVTITDNSGGDNRGIYVTERDGVYATAALTNTILANHSVGLQVTGGNTATLSTVLWHNSPTTVQQDPSAIVTITNQQTGNPAFAPDGFHITASSAAVDAAEATGLTTDIDGDVRPIGAATDIGADELAPTLTINYSSGAPGSYFTLQGNNFPANSTATISLNGAELGTEPTDNMGAFTILLTSDNADEGAYLATATVNPSAAVYFVVDLAAPERTQEGNGTTFDIPAGIALNNFVYLPAILR